MLRTADSVSPLEAPAVAVSLLMFIVIYFTVFSIGTFYILKLMGHAPYPGEPGPEREIGPHRAAGITPAPAVSPERTIGGRSAEART
jgi:cytochrome d ubiquinol oxidase subunit I